MAQTTVPATVSVQRIAPQLVAFAGSQINFQNLVTGLAQATPVQLFTVLPDGFTQVATFTPSSRLTPEQIAQVLESARQRLIGLGIATPTAEQLALTLTGGVVPTAFGGSQAAALINPPSPPSPAVQAQANAAAGASVSTSPVTVQVAPGAITPATTAREGAPLQRTNTSDSMTPPGATSRSPTPPTPGVAAGAPAAAQRFGREGTPLTTGTGGNADRGVQGR
jgi:hypothetical protein